MGIDRTFDKGEPGVYARAMVATHTDAAMGRYQSRPGRRAVVVASLADLHGPAEGRVELPIWLFWGNPDHTFDLADATCGSGSTRPCSGKPGRPRTSPRTWTATR